MGATVAIRFAAEHPDRVGGLVLIGAFAAYRDKAEIRALWDAVAALADPVDPGFARAFQESTVARPLADGLLDTAVAESLKGSPHGSGARRSRG